MKTCLKEIADLYSGIYAKPDPSGDVLYVQVRHFDEAGNFDPSTKPDLKLEGKSKKHLLQSGDILFAVKGNKNRAVLYQSHMAKAVASSVFMVIRIRNKQMILPEYLQWYFNHPQTQAWCSRVARGTNLPSITQEVLENLDIAIPSLQKQIKIVAATALMKKEKAILQQIHALRENQNQQILLQAIN